MNIWSCYAPKSVTRAWARREHHTAHQLSDSNCISVLPVVLLDGLMGVMAQPRSIQQIDLEYFLEFVLVSVISGSLLPTSLQKRCEYQPLCHSSLPLDNSQPKTASWCWTMHPFIMVGTLQNYAGDEVRVLINEDI